MLQFLRCLLVCSLVVLLALLASAVEASPARRVSLGQPVGLAIVGRVNTVNGAPLAGVFVTVQGAAASATTNSAGGFLLPSEQSNPVLTFKCAGYQTQTLLLKATGPVAVVLSEVGAVTAPQAAGLEVVKQLLVADEQPTFPGGAAAYRTFLQQNVHYPQAAKDKDISGDVYVSFVVDEMGRLLEAEVVKGVGYGLDEEALRLVRLMPWWTPAQLNGQPVRVPATLRVRFGLQPAQ